MSGQDQNAGEATSDPLRGAVESPEPIASSAEVAVALGRIPSGLFVITWREAERDRGMLASWVMQAGFEPPSISVAVGLTRGALGPLDGGGPFVVNGLGESQRSMLARFGRPAGDGFDPFEGLEVVRSPGGLAIVGGAVAWLECVSLDRASSGDHRLVVARVVAAGAAEDDARPLVHLRKNGLRY